MDKLALSFFHPLVIGNHPINGSLMFLGLWVTHLRKNVHLQAALETAIMFSIFSRRMARVTIESDRVSRRLAPSVTPDGRISLVKVVAAWISLRCTTQRETVAPV